MPTRAKSWIMQLRQQKHTANLHWVSWIRLKTTDGPHGSLGCGAKYAGGDREHPGNVSQPCAGHAARNTEGQCKCAWPSARPGRSSGPRRQWWNDWAAYTHSWLRTASEHDKWLCARLFIPHSLLDAVPQHEQYRLRSVAGLFQLR